MDVRPPPPIYRDPRCPERHAAHLRDAEPAPLGAVLVGELLQHQHAVGDATRSRNHHLDSGETQPEIGVDQFPKTFLAMHAAQLKLPGTAAIGHDAIVSADDAGEKAKPQDALAVVMFEAFIIDECDLFVEDSLEHLLVGGLLLAGMRKEKIGFPGQQMSDGDLFDAQEDVAAGEIFAYIYAGGLVFSVRVTPFGGSVRHDADAGRVLLDPFALSGGQRHPVVCGNFAFA